VSADILKRAAAKLRKHAEAATPGPWSHVDHGPPNGTFMGCGQVITMGDGVEGGDIAGPTGDCYPRSGYSPMDDMALIALMHPPVALALADLLDDTADDLVQDFGDVSNSSQSLAFAVARAILREEATS
jgi:hypothetical protein